MIWNYTFKKIGNLPGLPHTQGNSGNFQVIENLRETQEILIFFLIQGNSGQF